MNASTDVNVVPHTVHIKSYGFIVGLAGGGCVVVDGGDGNALAILSPPEGAGADNAS